ncbi:Transposon Ty3-I Gag-Pol [Labeo rohita]|uniref:Transposon Ty3-I Gag-Pol n=1 Tax=Labeo rohita TaxID=84645 RepID=A0A498LV47_LABRO|nr:Transposon Ty3-I Gag-Pol [Labeo rohita]
MEPKGTTKLICQFKDSEAETEFQVIEKDSPAILGRLECTELGLVKRIYKGDCEDNTDVLKEFDDVFNGLGCIPGVVGIGNAPESAIL